MTISPPSNKIPEAITPYYASLYSHKPIDTGAKDICIDTLRAGNRVLPPTATECGKPITAPELEDTMNLLPTGKAAGPDGLPNKFYKVFSKTLAPILEKVFEESLANGKLPPAVGDGLITLLYKKNARDDPTNYRPITLLNSDYKIMMRVLAKRMNQAVTEFVSDPQTGFVPDSFLPENTMLLKLIQDWADDEDEELYFLFLDMEKAFDRFQIEIRCSTRVLPLGPAPQRTADRHARAAHLDQPDERRGRSQDVPPPAQQPIRPWRRAQLGGRLL